MGGERKKGKGKSRRLELLSRLPPFLGKLHLAVLFRVSPVARLFATEILPSLKCKVSENKGKQDGGARARVMAVSAARSLNMNRFERALELSPLRY